MATATDQPTLVRAQVRHLRCSARKARVILDHVRGMSVMQAQATLQFSPRAAARDVLGLLRSATANAKENHDIDRAELVIDHCFADEDRTLKRFKPRARGRASSIHKRMCHVTIVLRHVAVAAAARHLRRPGHDRRREPPRAARRRVPGTAPRRRRGRRAGRGGARSRTAAAAAEGRAPSRARRKAEPPRRPRRRDRGRGAQAARAEGRRRRRRRGRDRRAEGRGAQGAPQEACREAHRAG